MYGMTVTTFTDRGASTEVMRGDPYENRTEAIKQIDEVVEVHGGHVEIIRTGGGRVALRNSDGVVVVWSITAVDERNRVIA